MKPIKLMIADDRDISRDILKLLLKSYKNIKVVAEATNGLEAIELIKTKSIDVVLMDINMPNLNGEQATKKIKELNPNIKIIINSFVDNPYIIKKLISCGASAYVKKGESINAYIEAIESIKTGIQPHWISSNKLDIKTAS